MFKLTHKTTEDGDQVFFVDSQFSIDLCKRYLESTGLKPELFTLEAVGLSRINDYTLRLYLEGLKQNDPNLFNK